MRKWKQRAFISQPKVTRPGSSAWASPLHCPECSGVYRDWTQPGENRCKAEAIRQKILDPRDCKWVEKQKQKPYLGPTPCLATHCLFSNRSNKRCWLLCSMASKKDERHQAFTQRLGLSQLGKRWNEGIKEPARGGQEV